MSMSIECGRSLSTVIYLPDDDLETLTLSRLTTQCGTSLVMVNITATKYENVQKWHNNPPFISYGAFRAWAL